MDAIPRKKVKKFEQWLAQMGAEILPKTNEFELLRFACRKGTGVIYCGKRGVSVNGAIVTEAFDCYAQGKPWGGKGKPIKKSSKCRLSTSFPGYTKVQTGWRILLLRIKSATNRPATCRLSKK